ncbi:Bcaba3 [Botrytis cinerea B05.10]|uniref:Alpha-ionylideneethane synthase aba3 n=4 Tax=Botryotinia fuckeliana TaxID=40559 RepID=ABA3_BOTFB|nr:Bcaba3 [Botrytis cinerea B05.10]A0A384JQC9.1 RecName: Full=Alpha-ionylideneethane synthase aba3; AltName: Full=Abscisic acid biosynthesis cluster protein 3; AltName: Full=Sesquiterpene synthase aba3 [Botrytis cinerea B05.10]ATZ52743.1 Bcaba3 [Botrytis cinerea B05.10]EMR90662.1 putative aba 3 protein [Botrytis cinerea BcDW1]CCD51887.1 BcABA3 [Botrytis cinerea T4]
MQQVITQTLVDDRFIQISDSKKSEGLATDSTKRQSQEQPIHDKDPIKAATAAMAATPLVKEHQDTWYYPPDIANDLQSINLPAELKGEIFACAWEYTRCVIPNYTNWNRYVAFMRIIIMGIIAEFRGEMVDVTASNNLLGYDLDATLAALFEGTPGHKEMAREYKTFLLITADKASERRDGELFRRYVNALAQSPRHWFRMRDCDALARFTIASALACNDLDDIWFTEDQFEILTEIGDTLYDAVAFYKHRAEGETNSTFAYMPEDLRIKAYSECREILWALDAAWARNPKLANVINFVRFFGGPIHMMMRRYRFVEENLTIGKSETDKVVDQTRKNFKLWNRVDANKRSVLNTQRYKALIARSEELMFPGLAEFLEMGGDGICDKCKYRESYGAELSHQFGGVELCSECRLSWRKYLECFVERATKVFPELKTHFEVPV